MTDRKTRPVLRPTSAAVLIAGIAAVTCAYLFGTPEQAAGVAVAFGILMAFMRRVVGIAPALALLTAITFTQSACSPAQKAAFEAAALSALELAAKAATRILLSEAERALKFGDSGGESP